MNEPRERGTARFPVALSMVITAVMAVASVILGATGWISTSILSIWCSILVVLTLGLIPRLRAAWIGLHILLCAILLVSWIFLYPVSIAALVVITAAVTAIAVLLNLPASRRVFTLRNANRITLGIAISTVFLFLTFRNTPFRRIWEAALGMNFLWLIPAVAVYIFAIWLRALRWRYIMNPVKRCGLRSLFPIYVISYMANNVLPLRMGDIYRAYIVGRKEHVSKAASLTTVAVERIFDGLTMLLFLVTASFFFPFSADIRVVIRYGSYGFVGLIVICYLALWRRKLAERLFRMIISPLPDRLRGKLDTVFSSFFDGLAVLKGPKDLMLVSVLSVATWVIEAVMYDLILRGFHVSVPFHAALSALAVVNLGIIIPAGPGYFGPFEYFCSLVLGPKGYGANPAFHLTEDIAKAYALILHVIGQWLPSTLLGLYYMWREHVTFHEVHDEMAGGTGVEGEATGG